MIVDALLALAETPVSETATQTVAATVLRPANLNDRWIRDAAVAAGARDDRAFLARLLRERVPGNASAAHVANLTDVVKRVARHYAAGVPSSDVGALVDFVGGTGNYDAALAAAYVGGLAEGWPYDAAPTLSDAQQAVVRNARGTLPEAFREGLDLLIEKWEIEGLAD
jgi:hypothetical protein